MKIADGTRWAGADWGNASHAICIVDEAGEVVCSVEAPHTADGLDELVSRLKEFAPIGGVCVETNHGLLVQKFLNAGIVVYPINPKVSKAWRDGWTAAAPKTDPHDAHVLADGLRHHHQRLHAMCQDDILTRELSMLCADESRLIEERTALIHKLKAALKEYHPTALDWFSDWTTPSSWDFILTFPKPQDLEAASVKKLTGFLRTHCIGISPVWEQRIRNRKASANWPADLAVIEAKSFLAAATAKQLRTLQASIKDYRKRIEKLFAEHPDSDIFSSLPGAGPKLAPRLLSQFGSQRKRFESAKEVQSLSGVVPVTHNSGDSKFIKFRHACQKDFRTTMHQFAYKSMDKSAWAKAFYDEAIAKGQKHNLALRNLASKWIKIIYRMWLDGNRYDESIYLASLVKKNSSIIHHIPSLKGCV